MTWTIHGGDSLRVLRDLPGDHVAEVTRLCTDGAKNACSILYAAVARACEAMGYDKVQTFILPHECGSSLKASGWQYEGNSSGNSWTTSKRARNADQDGIVKQRWSRVFRLPPNPERSGPTADAASKQGVDGSADAQLLGADHLLEGKS